MVTNEPAHGRVTLADIVVANAVCTTYREKGAAKVGAAAAIAATDGQAQQGDR